LQYVNSAAQQSSLLHTQCHTLIAPATAAVHHLPDSHSAPQYRSVTATTNTYDVNERFIERFDLDLVVLPPRDQLPPWLALHLDMLVRSSSRTCLSLAMAMLGVLAQRLCSGLI
jgi:hypothetical protein